MPHPFVVCDSSTESDVCETWVTQTQRQEQANGRERDNVKENPITWGDIFLALLHASATTRGQAALEGSRKKVCNIQYTQWNCRVSGVTVHTEHEWESLLWYYYRVVQHAPGPKNVGKEESKRRNNESKSKRRNICTDEEDDDDDDCDDTGT